jgi:hypothetical protein
VAGIRSKDLKDVKDLKDIKKNQDKAAWLFLAVL